MVRDVTSVNKDCTRRSAWAGEPQKALPAISAPAAVASLAPHRPRPYTTPQDCPAITRFRTASPAIRAAAISNRRGGTRLPGSARRSTSAASTARPSSVTASPPLLPNCPCRVISGSTPKLCHQPRCSVPRKLPAMKPGRATRAMALPLPAFTSVPEPQPITSCMAMPNTKAAAIMAMPTGAWAPLSSVGKEASSGKATHAVRPMARNWETRPRPSRSVTMVRHGPVKPKRRPSSVSPKPRPTSISKAARGPAMAKVPNTRPNPSSTSPVLRGTTLKVVADMDQAPNRVPTQLVVISQ